MSRIHWLPKALDDLKQIQADIGQDSPRNARRFVAKIRRSVVGLRRFPLAGGLVPEFEDLELRQTFTGSYRAVYRVRKNVVEVLRVIHGARKLPSSLRNDVE